MGPLPLISVIVCAHNEEEYVDKCLPSLISSLKGLHSEIIFVADRCIDSTIERAKKYKVKIIEKNWKKWRNEVSEALQAGYLASKGDFIGIIDIDIITPPNFFRDLTPVIKGDIASVAAHVITYPDTLWNRVRYAWEKTYDIAPLGKEPFWAARVILKKALDEIGGFRDMPTPDTDVDFRLSKNGYKSVTTPTVKAYHIRRISPRTMAHGQIRDGRGRYALGISLFRTMAHALFRFRPLVTCGWLLEWRKSGQRP